MFIFSQIAVSVITVFCLMYMANKPGNSFRTHAFTVGLGVTLLCVLTHPEWFTLTSASIPQMILFFSTSLGCSLYCFENSEDRS